MARTMCVDMGYVPAPMGARAIGTGPRAKRSRHVQRIQGRIAVLFFLLLSFGSFALGHEVAASLALPPVDSIAAHSRAPLDVTQVSGALGRAAGGQSGRGGHHRPAVPLASSCANAASQYAALAGQPAQFAPQSPDGEAGGPSAATTSGGSTPQPASPDPCIAHSLSALSSSDWAPGQFRQIGAPICPTADNADGSDSAGFFAASDSMRVACWIIPPAPHSQSANAAHAALNISGDGD